VKQEGLDGKHERHVVRAGLAGIERNKPLVVPGIVMKIAMFLVRLTRIAILRRI